MLIPLMVLFFILEIISQSLLYHNFDSSIIYYVYRVILILYTGILLIISMVFAVKYFLIFQRAPILDGKMSTRNKEARWNLTLLVLVSSAFVLLGMLMAILYVTLNIDGNMDNFWPFIYSLRLIELGFILAMIVTSLALMRNRVAYSLSKEDSLLDSSSSKSGLERELLPVKKATSSSTGKPSVARSGSVAARSGLAEPLMDYSNFGSAIEDDSEDGTAAKTVPMRVTASTLPGGDRPRAETGPMLDASSGEIARFEVGELAWAQYRMDGLWYAVRIQSVNGSEVEVEYVDYGLTDTLPTANVCPDHDGLLTGERLNVIKVWANERKKKRLFCFFDSFVFFRRSIADQRKKC